MSVRNMRDRIKRAMPLMALNSARALRVRRNRRLLTRRSKRAEPLRLTPDNSAEHYYHFLFDLALPLFLLLDQMDRDVPVIVDTTGPFIPRLEQIFPNRVQVPRTDAGTAPKHTLLGMNPIFVNVAPEEFRSFSRHVRAVSGATQVERNRVLLIERLPPQEFFRSQAKHTGGGASRRSIPNHSDLVQVLDAWVRPPFVFQNATLELLDFSEQVKLFASAVLVIGQHGAGLGNCVWMDPRSTVLELSNRPGLVHFEKISRGMGHRYVRQVTAGPHVPVDVGAFQSNLERLLPLAGGSGNATGTP